MTAKEAHFIPKVILSEYSYLITNLHLGEIVQMIKKVTEIVPEWLKLQDSNHGKLVKIVNERLPS
jgi:hypothetical protein